VTHFVLVHGGWHGPWCWSAQIAALREMGHHATAVRLPSDQVGVGSHGYAQVIAEAVGEPGIDVVVVGHSLAGLALPLVPDLVEVRALVYSAALLPEPGRSWLVQLHADQPMADWFHRYALPRQDSDAQRRSRWRPEIAAELFYHDCAPSLAAEASAQLRPQAPTPIVEITPLAVFPAVESHYFGCWDDRAVSATWQARTVPARLSTEISWIRGSHSPFLSNPTALAELLTELTEGAIRPGR
jgi:Alpha/beta hydrolase family